MRLASMADELYHLRRRALSWQSKSLAMKHYEETHSKGDENATINLGILCHEQGNVVRARRLFEETHNKGHVNATFNIGFLCKTKATW